MSYLFISHSSQNDFAAIALQTWLVDQGWDELFLDLDPERGIVAGERWERALHDAANRCDAVLFCVSQHWIDSEWCRKEFRLAHRLNKRIIGLLIEDIPIESLPAELTETWQLVNLATGNDHEISRVVHPKTGEEQHIHFSRSGLTRLKSGLVKAGLDPLFYDWPPKHDLERTPYRGMLPLEMDDAGIFFGREAPTNELLARLRGLRADPPPRFMVILGASGAGKSSFLRAGILPRLSRDERQFLTLPIIRPEHSVLWGEHGLLYSLNSAFEQQKMGITRGVLRGIIEDSQSSTEENIEEPKSEVGRATLKLFELLRELSQKSTLPSLEGETQSTHPTLVLTIDQGEELFHSEGAEEAKQFLELLKLLATDSNLPLIILFTIRSDSFEQLQTYKALEGLSQQTFSLTPMPQGAYHNVIEGPAARLKDSDRPLKIEAELTQQLLIDIEKGGNKDALPLLAFTLERLYVEYGGDGDLTLQEYHMMGGLEGAIEAAVERALQSAEKDPSLPNDRKAVTALLRRGLIPWLAGIDPDSQTPRRRVAKLSEIPAEAKPIIHHLIEQRLLATDIDIVTNETTIEPAHEALLRQWGLLQGWLDDDFAALTTLEGVQRASRDWEANERSPDWLSHNAGRLQDAEELKRREDLSQFLQQSNWDYLNECRILENEHRNKELAEAKKLAEAQKRQAEAQKVVAKRTTLGMSVAIVLTIIAGYFGWQAFEKQKIAEASLLLASQESDRATAQRDTALMTQSNFLMDLSRQQVEQGNYDIALLLGLNALPGTYGGERPLLQNIEPLRTAIQKSIKHSVFQENEDVELNRFSKNGENIYQFTRDSISTWSVDDGKKVAFFELPGLSDSVAYTNNDAYLLVVDNETLSVLNSVDGNTVAEFSANSEIRDTSFSSFSNNVALATKNGVVEVWNIENKGKTDNTDKLPRYQLTHGDKVNSVSYSHSGDFILTASDDGVAAIWSATKGERESTLNHNVPVVKAIYSVNDKYIATLSSERVTIWDAKEALVVRVIEGKSSFSDVIFNQKESEVLLVGDPKETGFYSFKKNNDKGNDSVDEDFVDNLFNFKDINGKLSIGAISPNQEYTLLAHSETQAFLVSNTDFTIKKVFLHKGDITSISFSPNSQYALTGSEDNTGSLWNIEAVNSDESNQLFDAEGIVTKIEYFKKQQAIVLGSTEGLFSKKLEENQDLTQLFSAKNPLDITFSENQKSVVSYTLDGETIVWDFELNKQVFYSKASTRLTNFPKLNSVGAQLIDFVDNQPAIISLSNNSKKILSGIDSKKDIIGMMFSPDDSQILIYSKNSFQIFDAELGKLIKSVDVDSEIVAMQFAPNSKDIILRDDANNLDYREVSSSDPIFKVKIDSNIAYIQFSPSGNKIAVGTTADKVVVLSSLDGAQLYELNHAFNQRHAIEMKGIINSSFAVFSPSGEFIITGSDDSQPILWRASNGQKLKHLIHDNTVTDVDFLSDEGAIITATSFGNVYRWDLKLYDYLSAAAQNALPLNRTCLTPAERAQFFLTALSSQQWIDRGCAHFSEEIKLAIENQSDSPLFQAFLNDDEALFDSLVKAGYSLEEYNGKGLTLLIMAIAKNNSKWIDKLLILSDNVDFPAKNGLTPIIIAIGTNNFELVKKLLDQGANLNHQDSASDESLLHQAVRDWDREDSATDSLIIDLLLAKGLDINFQDIDGNTPLHRAIKDEQKEKALHLVSSKANLNVMNNNGWSPTMLSVRRQQVDVLTQLLAAGADVNLAGKDQWNALHLSVGEVDEKQGETLEDANKIFELILKSGADVESKTNSGASALWLATANKRTEVVKVLLKSGVEIDSQTNRGNTALLEAAEEHQFNLFQLLIDSGANIKHLNKEGNTALHLILSSNVAENSELIAMVNKLIDLGADINAKSQKGYTPLLLAVKSGYVNVTKALIAAGANPNAKDIRKRTPLLEAVSKGHLEILDILLPLIDDIDHMPISGWNALLNTVDGSNSLKEALRVDIAQRLLAHGANINSQLNSGKSVLNLAVSNDLKLLFDLYIRSGANVNLTDKQGRTALFEAAFDVNTRADMISTLIAHGADVNLANSDGWSPLLVMANKINSKDELLIVKLLTEFLKAGVNIDHKNSNGYTAVLIATEHNKKALLKVLLDKGASPDLPNNSGWTALMQAINMGDEALFNLLLSANASPNVKADDGWNALHLTVNKSNKGSDEVNSLFAKALLKNGADKNAQTNGGETAVSLAVFNNRIKVFDVLIESGVDLNLSAKNGWTPLMRAVNLGYVDMATAILNAKADVNKAENGGWTALHLTVDANTRSSERINLQLAKLLLANGAKIDQENNGGNTALSLSIINEQKAIFDFLLGKNANVNVSDKEGYTPLLRSIGNGRVEIAKILIEKVKDINSATKNGWNALHLTVDGDSKLSKAQNFELAKHLVRKSINLNATTESKYSALQLSILNKNEKIFDLLLDNQALLDTFNVDGYSPLMSAIESGNFYMFNRLMDAGTIINGSSENGWNALHFAVEDNRKGDPLIYPKIISRLLEKGIKIDGRTNSGLTAIHLAVWNDFPVALKLLIEKGADINQANNDGWTPLMRAVDRENYNMVKDLIAAGANISPKNKNGETALMIAKKLEQDELIVKNIILLLTSGDKN
jgi:ankyrin repeat protein/WD40 repeat protein